MNRNRTGSGGGRTLPSERYSTVSIGRNWLAGELFIIRKEGGGKLGLRNKIIWNPTRETRSRRVEINRVDSRVFYEARGGGRRDATRRGVITVRQTRPKRLRPQNGGRRATDRAARRAIVRPRIISSASDLERDFSRRSSTVHASVSTKS